MIAYLRGRVISRGRGSIVLLTAGGVGYEVHLTPEQVNVCQPDNEVTFYTYLKVTDQAHDLYGFANVDERDFFLLLMTVSGVGPKSALNILALGSMADIKSAIARGDVKYLTSVQGMGKKTAERVVVELKSKIDSLALSEDSASVFLSDGNALGDVVDGLTSMGYSADDARQTVRQIDTSNKNSDEIMREALRMLSR